MRELDLPWINILQLDLLETTHSTHILTNTQTRNGIKKKLTKLSGVSQILERTVF